MSNIKEWLKERMIRMMEINTKNISAAILHQQTFPQFKNLCRGEQPVVVCGAGPSLQNYKPISGAVNIALNRAFLFENVKFDFIFAQDYDGIKMVIDELIEYEGNSCIKLLARSNGDSKEIPESLAIKCSALRFATDAYQLHDGYRSKFVVDIEARPLGGMPNVGIAVMQFALYLNPSKLYIVGCDMTGTHFADGNQTNEELKAEKKQYDNYWVKENEKLINKWRELKEFAHIYYPDTQIISVNPVGLKGIFDDLYQD